MNMPIYLTTDQWQSMQKHVAQSAPEEACGLLSGIGLRVKTVIPVVNVLHSPVRFRMDPVEQLKAFIWMEEQHQELLAVYHSHPAGPHQPSPTDHNEFAYPGVRYIIWSGLGGIWTARAFHLGGGLAEEIRLEIEADE